MADHRLPPDSLREAPADELAFKAIEHIWMSFDTPYEPDPRYGELTVGQRSLYALLWARAEIGNGGFAQFFTNSTGFFARDLPDAARRVGLDAHAALFERANSLFPGGDVPRDREDREGRFDALSERRRGELDRTLDDLDDTFYERQTEFDEALARYVNDHAEEFLR